MDGSTASRAKRRKGSPCHHDDDDSADGQTKGYSGTNLPKDIWWHIHSLMPMRDAARVACVARAFLSSWRCYPNLDFSEETLGLMTENESGSEEETLDFVTEDKAIRRDLDSRVDHILQNHSGMGVKTVRFELDSDFSKQVPCHHGLDRWLQKTVKQGIEELDLFLDHRDSMYNFPCSLLSDEIGGSLRYLRLAYCNFHPTTSGLGYLRRLTTLELTAVSITDNELECLLSNCPALERLELSDCDEIVHLKIPCLQRLSHLKVASYDGLQVLESKAPNVFSVYILSDLPLQLSLPETSRIKNFEMSCCSEAAFYARTSLPSSMPNLETLTLFSAVEQVNTPVMPSRFLHLKFLSMSLRGWTTYDYFSLSSFVDASPSLEDFELNVFLGGVKHVSVFDDPSKELRKMQGNRYDKLKRVQIFNFSSARSLVELTCHIVESATSLECLTLDSSSTRGVPRCSDNKPGRCLQIGRFALLEAHRGVLAAQRYIKPKVPSTVEFIVMEPCSRCHAV